MDEKGGRDIVEQASELLEKRLGQYQEPAMDQGILQELSEWMVHRRQEILNH